ncbi:MAG: ribosome silencing factor [Actinomycetes bacterium]
MAATEQALNMAQIAAQAAFDKKAENVALLDVSEHLVITDIFLIASGSSDRQVNAIVDGIEEALAKAGFKPIRREGHREGRWVLLDYFDIVVHVQQSEERSLYDLERLWADCPQIPVLAS